MSDPDPFKERLLVLAKLKTHKARTARADEDAGKELTRYQEQLWQDMDDAGVDGSSYTGEGRFDRKSTPYGQIVDLDAYVAWVKEQGIEEVLQTKAQPGRLNELVRDRLNNNEELPPGTSFYEKRYISWTKPK